MNRQYKLYILDKSCYTDTLNKLYNKYGNDSIIEINKNMIAIEYNYKTTSYRKLIESMNEYRSTQSIITTSKFIKLMKSCIESNILIDEIILSDMLKDESISINNYIKKINYKIDKEKYIKKLLDEINWLSYEEGIDIQSISYKVKSDKSPIYINFNVFNNGVISIDDESIISQVIKVIKDI